LAQVGIGINSPSGSAQLEITSTSKGMLIPRMNKSQRLAITSPAVGLMVYQTDDILGFYYYSGTEWQLMSTETTTTASISTLDLANARLEPSTYTSGVAYTGVLIIPYLGGNGGNYANGTSISSSGVTGLSATLKGGTLNYGAGELVYDISGTPSASSPNKSDFSIPTTLGAAGGTASVGNGRVIKIGEAIIASYKIPKTTATAASFDLGSYVTANNLTPLPTIDGLEANIFGNGITYYRPRIYNRLSTPQTIFFQTWATQVNQSLTRLNRTINSGAYEDVDWDADVYWTTTAGEVITTNVQVDVGAYNFHWYEFKWWCMEVGSDKIIFISVVRNL
jgi:hypothetical protein